MSQVRWGCVPGKVGCVPGKVGCWFRIVNALFECSFVHVPIQRLQRKVIFKGAD